MNFNNNDNQNLMLSDLFLWDNLNYQPEETFDTLLNDNSLQFLSTPIPTSLSLSSSSSSLNMDVNNNIFDFMFNQDILLKQEPASYPINNSVSVVEQFTNSVTQQSDIIRRNNIKKPKKRKRKKTIVDPNAPPKPKRNTGLNKPLMLSASLQSIMDGEKQLSRPEIVKRLWNYIKLNQLQDPADKRFILCDEKLKSIFHKDRVNSFGMNRDLSAHLTKTVSTTEVSTIDNHQFLDLFSPF